MTIGQDGVTARYLISRVGYLRPTLPPRRRALGALEYTPRPASTLQVRPFRRHHDSIPQPETGPRLWPCTFLYSYRLPSRRPWLRQGRRLSLGFTPWATAGVTESYCNDPVIAKEALVSPLTAYDSSGTCGRRCGQREDLHHDSPFFCWGRKDRRGCSNTRSRWEEGPTSRTPAIGFLAVGLRLLGWDGRGSREGTPADWSGEAARFRRAQPTPPSVLLRGLGFSHPSVPRLDKPEVTSQGSGQRSAPPQASSRLFRRGRNGGGRADRRSCLGSRSRGPAFDCWLLLSIESLMLIGMLHRPPLRRRVRMRGTADHCLARSMGRERAATDIEMLGTGLTRRATPPAPRTTKRC